MADRQLAAYYFLIKKRFGMILYTNANILFNYHP